MVSLMRAGIPLTESWRWTWLTSAMPSNHPSMKWTDRTGDGPPDFVGVAGRFPPRVRERAYRSSLLASRGKGGPSRSSTGGHVPNTRIGEPWRILSTLWARPRFGPNRPPTGSFVSTRNAEPGCRAPHWDRLPQARLVVGRQAGTKASTIPLFTDSRNSRNSTK